MGGHLSFCPKGGGGGGKRKKNKRRRKHGGNHDMEDDEDEEEEEEDDEDDDEEDSDSDSSGSGSDCDDDSGGSSGGDGGDGGAEPSGMYAGGEDERPGGDPPADAGAAVRLSKKDFQVWFSQHVQHDENGRDAIIGRSIAVPYPWEVIVQTPVMGASLDDSELSDAEYEHGDPCGVCLVTQCSVDRLDRLEAQMQLWPGEMSAAVFIDAPAESEQAAEDKRSILEAYLRSEEKRKSDGFKAQAATNAGRTITVVYQLPAQEVKCPAYDTLYPVNKLRNEALRGARSQLVLLVDVDFLPSDGLYGSLCGKDDGRKLFRALCGPSRKSDGAQKPRALVIPAFEARSWKKEEVKPHGQMLSHGGLKEAYEAGDTLGFHTWYFPKGHGATNFQRWFAGPAEEDMDRGVRDRLRKRTHGVNAYHVEYEEGFEPYVVAARHQVPAYDERFKGYGMNKISHLHEMAKGQGFKFFVMDNFEAFLVAKWHPRSAAWHCMYGKDAEKTQLLRVASHYRLFKEEVKSRARRQRGGQSGTRSDQTDLQALTTCSPRTIMKSSKLMLLEKRIEKSRSGGSQSPAGASSSSDFSTHGGSASGHRSDSSASGD
mmetsp:Transcript_15970/g.37652  ORF Transcript_15970/g.37652 Transcript_15970/m.37652 type:complete len:598 (-) Transcript_15970:50-1843(-)